MVHVELIRKLHLRKGHKYVLFLPIEAMPTKEVISLMEAIGKMGIHGLGVIVNGQAIKKIKVVEKEVA